MSMFKKTPPRNEVISLRLNEERLTLLERYREVLAARLGRAVSIAEAAFQMMEGRAVEVDRETTRGELLLQPTTALDRIRRRWAAEHKLSAAEWDVLAVYMQVGAEEERQAPPLVQPTVPARESYIALLDAFQVVYQHRKDHNSRHTWVYFGNLGGHETGARLSDADAHQRDRALMLLIEQRRELLRETFGKWEYPGNVGRCLLIAIQEEGLDGTELDRILAPYWPTLWGLAARGHWIRHNRQPVRSASTHVHDVRQRFAIPDALTAGDLTISFASAGPELATQIDFGARRFSYLIHRYPELMEFRAMLEGPG